MAKYITITEANLLVTAEYYQKAVKDVKDAWLEYNTNLKGGAGGILSAYDDYIEKTKFLNGFSQALCALGIDSDILSKRADGSEGGSDD